MKIILAIDAAQPLAAYRDALLAAGALPAEVDVVLPGDPLPEEFDGLLLSGGVDVDPARYGETPLNGTVVSKPERDELDFGLLSRADGIGAAVFGICRGLQVVNVALGGTLWQDLPEQRERGVRHAVDRAEGRSKDHLAHPVRTAPHAPAALPFARLLASADGALVNSRHHQAVKDLAPGLVALAASPDDLVEAFARESGPFLAAVQWHPENLVGRADQRALFGEFLEAARARAGRRAGIAPAVPGTQNSLDAPPAPLVGADRGVEGNETAPPGSDGTPARAARPAPVPGEEPEPA